MDATVYPDGEACQLAAAITTSKQKSMITPEILSKRWNIGLAMAKRMLCMTTQAGVQNVFPPSKWKVQKKAHQGGILGGFAFNKVPGPRNQKGTLVRRGSGTPPPCSRGLQHDKRHI